MRQGERARDLRDRNKERLGEGGRGWFFRTSSLDRVTESTHHQNNDSAFPMRWHVTSSWLCKFYICYIGGRMFSHMIKMFTVVSQEKKNERQRNRKVSQRERHKINR